MTIKIGEVEALFRYPVKSMRGEALQEAQLGWHGLVGDRRLAFRRVDDRSGFPWLTACKLPELILFAPVHRGANTPGGLPTHVRTLEGKELGVFSQELAAEVGRRHGSPVEMTHLDRGIFDEASISAITTGTVDEIARLVSQRPDVRRFRPNILISSQHSKPFTEDAWVGSVLTFGDGDAAAAIAVTNWDERCAMVTFDPDSGARTPAVLKTVVRERDNKAGVYGTVTRCGRLAVGQPLYLTPPGTGSESIRPVAPTVVEGR